MGPEECIWSHLISRCTRCLKRMGSWCEMSKTEESIESSVNYKVTPENPGMDGICQRCGLNSWVTLCHLMDTVASWDEWRCICCEPLAPEMVEILSRFSNLSDSMVANAQNVDKIRSPVETQICGECAKARCVNCKGMLGILTCRICFDVMCSVCHVHMQGLRLCFTCAESFPVPVKEDEIPW